MIEFADPLLLALLAAPWPARRLLPPADPRSAALLVPDEVARLLEEDAAQPGQAPGARAAWLAPALIWVLLVVALAGPRQVLPVPALKVSGRDLAIAIDLSGSMVREDFDLDGTPITRIDAVKRVGAAFIRGRGGDRVALIAFGSEAYYAAPFTYDTDAVARRLEEAAIGISGRATNISGALGLALKRLGASDAATRVVVLLSDGIDNAGTTSPLGAADLAARMGVRVHTIALGPKDLATGAEGERGVVDAATLAAISERSGGESFRVRTTEDLRAVADAIDRLEATDRDGLAAEIHRELWVWPAALAGALALWVAWRTAA